MWHTLATILFQSTQYANSRLCNSDCLLDQVMHCTSFNHASSAWTRIYYDAMVRRKKKKNAASEHSWHTIAHARPYALQKARFIKSLQFSLMRRYANLH